MRGVLERGRVRGEHDVRQQQDFTVPPCWAVDPSHPVVCCDESPTQLIGEVREPVPAAPGQPERYDYEYRRNGTANLFVFLDVHQPWRHLKVTEHRAARDFALCMRDLADTPYPDADLTRVVMDNSLHA